MVWGLMFSGILAFVAFGWLSMFRADGYLKGRRGAIWEFRLVAVSSAAFALLGLHLLFMESWIQKPVSLKGYDPHAMAIGSLINAVLMLGPQLTAVVVLGIAFWLAQAARLILQRINSGIYDL